MKKDYVFIGTILAFGICGEFGASLLFVIWTWLFQPELFRDGQYVMVFIVTTPLGGLVGSALGMVRAFTKSGIVRPHHPFLMGFGLVFGSTFIVPIAGVRLIVMLLTIIGERRA